MHTVTRRDFCGQALAAAALAWRRSPSHAAEKAAGWDTRFCVCNELFGDWPMEKAVTLAAECGYRGIEIAPFTIDPDVRRIGQPARQNVRRQTEQAGLTVVGLHWLLAKTTGFHLTSPDAEMRRRTADYLGDLACCCADMGGRLLIFGSPKQRNLLPGVTKADAMRYAAEVIQRAIPVLEKTAVTLALEPLSPRTTDFLTTAAEAAALAKQVASPRCRLHLDCLAMSTERQPIPALLRQHRDLVHFHANDANQQGPGFGKLDFVPILRALKEIEYQGWISVEVFDYSPGRERLARESIAYLRKCAAVVA